VTSAGKTCYALLLGSLEYRRALELQMQVCEMKKKGFREDVLLVLEHPPTITLGRNGRWHHLLASKEELAARGVECFEVDRGGDITFHGPGQVVGYPLLHLEGRERDVHRYMRCLEEVLLRVLQAYGIESGRREGLTGVWTGEGKIAAMGVHISRWITRHGFALNVRTDLAYFSLIVPCGIAGEGVASMSSVLRRDVEVQEVADLLVREFGSVFGRRMAPVSEDDLHKALQTHAHQIAVA
jgi:lipoyl(octanoyl) transferase